MAKKELSKVSAKFLNSTERRAIEKLMKLHQPVLKEMEKWKEQREIIVLRHYANLSFKEIAQMTNCSINTALGRMRYGLINLRKMMNERGMSL